MRPRLAGSTSSGPFAAPAGLFTMDGRIREPALRVKLAQQNAFPGLPGLRSTGGPRGRRTAPRGQTSHRRNPCSAPRCASARTHPAAPTGSPDGAWPTRSEEHTSELQSHVNLVCRRLLEKKKTLLPILISCLIWLDLVASLPLIKERILVIILLLHFLSLMLGSLLVLMLPLLVWFTPDLS